MDLFTSMFINLLQETLAAQAHIAPHGAKKKQSKKFVDAPD